MTILPNTTEPLSQGTGFNAGYQQAIEDVIAFLLIQHEASKNRHNYWHVAANTVKDKYLPETRYT